MRIAVLADIHGNLPAFEAALKHVARQKADQIVIAGDIINCCPDSADCWKLALSLGCPIIRGNHERYVAHYNTLEASPDWTTELFAPLQWTMAQLTEDDIQTMAQLPLNISFPEFHDLFFVHASERNDKDNVVAYTSEEQLNEMFQNVQASYIIRSHNHQGQINHWNNRFIITNSSVGLPLDRNPTAQYLLLEKNHNGWHFQHQSVDYNIEASVKRFYDTGYITSSGPMAKLYLRELITATAQISPFLRFYKQWSEVGNLSLNQAVDKFLGADLLNYSFHGK